MKGYKCDLKQDELVKLKDDFWSYINSLDPYNKKTLGIIRQATLMDFGKLYHKNYSQ